MLLAASLRRDRESALALLAREPLASLLDGIDPGGLADCIVAMCACFDANADLREIEVNPVAILDGSQGCAILDALVAVAG